MQLIDTLPETVYRVCDLIGVITNRNGAKWRDQALTSLVAEVSFLGKKTVSTFGINCLFCSLKV